MKQELIKLDRARQILATVSSAMEAKKVADVARGLEVVAARQKDEEVMRYAREIHADALRLEGHFLANHKARPGPKRSNNSVTQGDRTQKEKNATLDEQKINKRESVAAQAVAEAADTDEQAFQDFRSGKMRLNALLRRRRKKRQAEQIRKAQLKPKQVNPTGPFDLILSDPPWRYEHCESDNREIENQYPTLTTSDISKDKPNSATDSILFLWSTAPKLEEALRVMKEWGFKYRSCAVWDKVKIGMGYWWRIQHELLLVGVRGRPKATPECQRVSSIFVEKRGAHSAKPTCVYDWIESSFPELKKLEMYARSTRQGWASHGNEL